MAPNPPHRKRVRHYEDPGHLHELTFSCCRRMPLLTNNLWRETLGQAIDPAMIGQGYRLAAFVYMREHVHLIVYPQPNAVLPSSGAQHRSQRHEHERCEAR